MNKPLLTHLSENFLYGKVVISTITEKDLDVLEAFLKVNVPVTINLELQYVKDLPNHVGFTLDDLIALLPLAITIIIYFMIAYIT